MYQPSSRHRARAGAREACIDNTLLRKPNPTRRCLLAFLRRQKRSLIFSHSQCRSHALCSRLAAPSSSLALSCSSAFFIINRARLANLCQQQTARPPKTTDRKFRRKGHSRRFVADKFPSCRRRFSRQARRRLATHEHVHTKQQQKYTSLPSDRNSLLANLVSRHSFGDALLSSPHVFVFWRSRSLRDTRARVYASGLGRPVESHLAGLHAGFLLAYGFAVLFCL